jgi:multidrug efflux pump subunit AcrA (membrane-fusion protein)
VTTLFRQEALEHHANGQEHGDVLRYNPKWITIAFKLVVAAAFAALLFTLFFSVDEYASGPAVVRVDGRRMITTSASAGVVDELTVRPGQGVTRGAMLVRLNATDELVELARATDEFELQLARQLVDPNDGVAKQTLSSLRARREAAKNNVESRTLRAPFAGTISDVRVRPGQHVTPGEVLCALVPVDAKTVSLVAMVPADYRPMLKSGLKMRFELDGFKYEYADVEVQEVSAEAVGTSEVMRFLGNERGDAVRLDPGGKVLVTAKLPTASFVSEGQPYGYFDGLTGTAEIRVRREPIIVTLIPALRQVFQ